MISFMDLNPGDTILYTYNFSDTGLATAVGIVGGAFYGVYITDIYSSVNSRFSTSLKVMASDPRATLIAVVLSLEDAEQSYPELFI